MTGNGAVVLLSGGLDSAVCLALNPDAVTLSIDYGQPHAQSELDAAARVAQHYGVEHVRADASLPTLHAPGDASMLVPGRNLVLLSLAAALAEARNLRRVVFGANADDRDGYPDCRREFIDAARAVMPVEAPLLDMSKEQIGALARRLAVPVDMTWSCYYPAAGEPCGTCDACKSRERALP
jgi:7-cyano-7-deazaguanine synthase